MSSELPVEDFLFSAGGRFLLEAVAGYAIKKVMKVASVVIVDENRDITNILAGAFGLKGFEVFKAYSTEECLNKANELDGKVDIVFMNGKIAANRGAMLIIKVKRVNPNIKIMILAEDETDKTRVLEYGA